MKALILGALFLGASAFPAVPAGAQAGGEQPALRELCADRPGFNTAACTVDPGHVQAEMSIAGWTLDRGRDERTDSIDAGDILLRYGVGPATELRFGWTAFGHVRTRDRMTGDVERTQGVGDVTLGLKQNLRHPAENTNGLALALLPYATLPVGRDQIGAGDWGAGLIVPITYTLGDDFVMAFSPEIDAAVNESGSGRHLAYGTAMGMEIGLGGTVTLTPEIQIMRDRDPERHAWMNSAALSFDAQPAEMMQIDVQASVGLDRDAPDLALAFGITRKF